MPVNTLGRELIELVQIDQDFCNNTYGVAPCSPITRTYFNFKSGSEINIPTTEFAGDFELNIGIRTFLNATARIVGSSIDSGYNAMRLDCVTYSIDTMKIRLAVYSGETSALVVLSDSIPKSTSANIELSRTGSVFTLKVTGSADKVFDIGSVFTVQVDKVATVNYTFQGYIYDLEMIGSTGGNRFYPIDDDSTTITDITSSENGTLTIGTGGWVYQEIAEKCFHTYRSCQDKVNYDRGTKKITLKKNQAGDVDEYTIPILKNFSVTLPELNLFSRDTKNQALGKFGKCTVSCSDTIFSDNHLDPYVSERSYNPLDQGTFWTKWLARNPYYEGWKIRLYDGEVGQTLAEMNVREYELEKITNPDSNGNVKITATDIMRKFDKNKAIYPPPSNAILFEDIEINDTTFTTLGRLTDYDEGDGFKFALIGGESSPATTAQILNVADNSDGTFTYPILGSWTQAFSAGVVVENAVNYSVTNLTAIVLHLLSYVYDPSEYDAAEITSELAYIQSDYTVLTRYIAKPTPVFDIMAELAEQCGFYIWYDDIDKLVKVKAIRDEESPVIELNESSNLIEGKTKPHNLSENRISQTYITYNYTNDLTGDPEDYSKSVLTVADESISDNEYGSSNTKNMDALWLNNDVSAFSTGDRMLKMFTDSPKEISFELDIKDDLRIAQVFKLAWSGFADLYGNPELKNWICTGRTRQGSRLKITAQEFKFNVPEA